MFCNTSFSSSSILKSLLAMLTHAAMTAAEIRVLVICTMSFRAFCKRLYVSLIHKRYATLLFLNCSFGRSSLSSSKSASSISKSPAYSSGSISCTKSCGCLTSSSFKILALRTRILKLDKTLLLVF